MKKRTTITTQKREIWIITEDGPTSQIPDPASADRTATSELPLVPNKQSTIETEAAATLDESDESTSSVSE